MKTQTIKKRYLCNGLCLLLSAGISLTGCDDGDIRDTSGTGSGNRNFTVTVRFGESDAWPSTYTMALAAYENEESRLPLVKATIARPTDDDEEKIVYLPNVPAQARQLCISLLSGSVRQHDYYVKDISQGETDVTYHAGTLHIATLSHVQRLVFDNNCTRCHGANGTATAALDLTDGKAHASLVNRPALCTTDGSMRVVPGNAGNSFLYRMLTDNDTEANRNGLNHTDMLDATDLTGFVASWINHGAGNF